MQYLVKFIYNDNTDLDVNIEKDKLQEFFACLDRKQIYWADKEESRGFWLDLKNIRYIQLIKPEEKINDAQRADTTSEVELPVEDGGDSSPEGDSESK